VNLYVKEIQRIISRINEHLANGDKPDIDETNELVEWISDISTSTVKYAMTKVFRRQKTFDDTDRENVHYARTAYRETVDKL
jgi:hypothetical protein